MNKKLSKEQQLRKFSTGKKVENLNTEQEIKAFEEFQRFNLIRAGATGKFRITKQGRQALIVGLKQYLVNVRLEKKLFKDYMKSKMQERWILMFGVLVLLFVLTSYAFLFH